MTVMRIAQKIAKESSITPQASCSEWMRLLFAGAVVIVANRLSLYPNDSAADYSITQ
jgi:hypothetical protein